MQKGRGIVYDDVSKCVDEVIAYIGKDICFGMPLALGKPVRFANELYKRAKEDPSIKLKIVTALPLEKPQGKSELENEFYRPLFPNYLMGFLTWNICWITVAVSCPQMWSVTSFTVKLEPT